MTASTPDQHQTRGRRRSRYVFADCFVVANDVPDVWSTILHRYANDKHRQLTTPDAPRLVVGERTSWRVRSPFGYAVRFHATISDVVDERTVEAKIEGDIVGQGTVELRREHDRTLVEIRWDVVVHRRLLRALSIIAHGALRWAHNVVVRHAVNQISGADVYPSRSMM